MLALPTAARISDAITYAMSKTQILAPNTIDEIITHVTQNPTDCFSNSLAKYTNEESNIVSHIINILQLFQPRTHIRFFTTGRRSSTAMPSTLVKTIIVYMLLGFFGAKYLRVYADSQKFACIMNYILHGSVHNTPHNTQPPKTIIIKRDIAPEPNLDLDIPLSKLTLSTDSNPYDFGCLNYITTVGSFDRFCPSSPSDISGTDALFMSYPELNILSLCAEDLEQNETIAIMGIEKINIVEELAGIPTLTAPYTKRQNPLTTLILVPIFAAAKTYSEYTSLIPIATAHRGLRLMNSPIKLAVVNLMPIDRDIRFIQLYLAVSASNNDLIFVSAPDFSQRVIAFMNYIKTHEYTIADLTVSLKKITDEIHSDAINGYNSINLKTFDLFARICV